MSGIGSAVRGTVNNVNRTVHNVGTATAVAAQEAPRFNNNLNNLNGQAGALNQNAANGIDIFDQQAGNFNSVAGDAVGEINALNGQAEVLNQNAANGISVFDQQAGQLNRVAEGAVGEINALNGQAKVLNQNAANGINALDQQAGEFNVTAENAAQDVARAVESFESTSEVVSEAIAMWAPSIQTFLAILGPLQYFAAAHYFVLILKTLGVLQSRGGDAQAWKELRVTNAILQSISDYYREVNLPGIVQNITKSSIVYEGLTETITSYFFYSKNNIVVQQLRGLGYFAYDSIPELFQKAYIWNAFADAVKATNPSLSKFGKRHTQIYFLDPFQNPNVLLSHMEFTKIHQNVTIVNHHKAKQHVILQSIKVHEGCCLTLKNASVCKIDATYGGKAILQHCNVSWKQDLPPPIPFLFGGRPDKFNNPYNVCGTVSCRECTTYDPSKDKSASKNMKQFFKQPSGKYVRVPEKSSILQRTVTKATIEWTITNVSDEFWHVKFEPRVGVVSSEGPAHTFKGDPQNMIWDNDESLALPPKGGSIAFHVTSDVGGAGFFSFAKEISGTLIFVDKNGTEHRHDYKGHSDLSDFTIVCPAIERNWGAANVFPEIWESNFSLGSKSKSLIEGTAHSDTETCSHCDDHNDPKEKKNTILVVGRFGSGKSTFLNTVAGVHWKVALDATGGREFIVNQEAEEKFATSRSAKGCTLAAVADDITTFDGREITVIDTVGYEDNINADAFYNTSNLTEVMNKYKEISAVVIVVNSQDPRLTRGFVESLACVPTSFKAKIQKNIVLVFTKWTEDDEDDYGDKSFRGFTEQVKIIRSVLGFNENDEIKAFWMDNRPFKKYERARRTIDNLSSFLDHVVKLPRLSCPEFKEMRALSQYERTVRKEINRYFQPSNQDEKDLSGFEKFLLECARRRAVELKKVTWNSFTAKAWSDKLVGLMQQEIEHGLPKEIQRICCEVAVKLKANSMTVSDFDAEFSQNMVGTFVLGLMHGGFWAIVATAPLTLGGSLLALPGCLALSYAHSKTWSRDKVIKRVVFKISEKHGDSLCSHITSRFSSHVDQKAEELQEFFNSL